jgi:(p)ppGpp synthase/HD superfamily hydrolase
MTIGYSASIYEALSLAARAHRDQLRKGTDVPYIVHPVQVAMILLAHGFEEDVAIAGLLHDTVEDCDVTLDDIRARFGDGVAALVDGVTEKKSDASAKKRPWRVRKEEQLAHLAHADRPTAALKAADALHNASCTLADVRAGGADVWKRFNAAPADSIWYYQEVARLVADRLGQAHALARELATTVAALAATLPSPTP